MKTAIGVIGLVLDFFGALALVYGVLRQQPPLPAITWARGNSSVIPWEVDSRSGLPGNG